MNLKELVSKIAKAEGKKHQASVGDVREIIGLVSDELAIDPTLGVLLIVAGQRRAKRKKK